MRITNGFQIGTLLLLSATFGACADNPSEPPRPKVPTLRADEASIPCDKQDIPDPSCEALDPNSPGTFSFFYPELPSSPSYNSSTDAGASFTYEGNSYPCPATVVGSVTGIVRHPKTGDDYEFNSQGRWTLNLSSSLIYLLSGQAVYDWPQASGGWWPAFNLDKMTGVAQIKISQGRGVCLSNSVNFIQFYGVQIVDPDVRPTSNSGGGGPSEGNGSNCSYEYIYVEYNNDDGTGWHLWWEGWATVCG